MRYRDPDDKKYRKISKLDKLFFDNFKENNTLTILLEDKKTNSQQIEKLVQKVESLTIKLNEFKSIATTRMNLIEQQINLITNEYC